MNLATILELYAFGTSEGACKAVRTKGNQPRKGCGGEAANSAGQQLALLERELKGLNKQSQAVLRKYYPLGWTRESSKGKRLLENLNQKIGMLVEQKRRLEKQQPSRIAEEKKWAEVERKDRENYGKIFSAVPVGRDTYVVQKPVFAYHVTDASNVKSILKQGLYPEKSERPGDEGARLGVYLTDKSSLGVYRDMIRRDGGKPAVVAVRIPKGTKFFQNILAEEPEMILNRKVPPGWLRLSKRRD